MSIVTGYDPTTLKEIVDVEAATARLDELGEQRSTEAVNEKVSLLRLLGRLDEALDAANDAVRQARFGGDRERLVLARLRRALVLQAQGKHDKALVELGDCAMESHAHEWHSTEAFALQHRGKVEFDRGEFARALRDFRDALTIRVRIRADADQIDSSMLAIAITEARLEGREVSADELGPLPSEAGDEPGSPDPGAEGRGVVGGR